MEDSISLIPARAHARTYALERARASAATMINFLLADSGHSTYEYGAETLTG